MKRARMFAGPNGSGKSSMYRNIKSGFDIDFGIYVNADDIKVFIEKNTFLDFYSFGLENITENDFLSFANEHSLTEKALKDGVKFDYIFEGKKIKFNNYSQLTYEPSIIADYIRYKLTDIDVTFTFETVMSHKSKIEFFKKTKELGYKNYLYFISTSDVSINKSRVYKRVLSGGHDVPKDRIEKRYYRSLDLLSDIIPYTHKAYIFDNSDDEADFILEIIDGKTIHIKNDKLPKWVVDNLLGKFKIKKK